MIMMMVLMIINMIIMNIIIIIIIITIIMINLINHHPNLTTVITNQRCSFLEDAIIDYTYALKRHTPECDLYIYFFPPSSLLFQFASKPKPEKIEPKKEARKDPPKDPRKDAPKDPKKDAPKDPRKDAPKDPRKDAPKKEVRKDPPKDPRKDPPKKEAKPATLKDRDKDHVAAVSPAPASIAATTTATSPNSVSGASNSKEGKKVGWFVCLFTEDVCTVSHI